MAGSAKPGLFGNLTRTRVAEPLDLELPGCRETELIESIRLGIVEVARAIKSPASSIKFRQEEKVAVKFCILAPVE